jgi:aspartyl-tRNA synthetase
MTRTRQTIYIEVVAKEITIVEVSRETPMETASEEAVSEIVDLIIDIIYHYHSLNKRSTIYIGNLNAGQ